MRPSTPESRSCTRADTSWAACWPGTGRPGSRPRWRDATCGPVSAPRPGPYLGGSALITTSALFNRTGEKKYVITAALANFGGTLFLAYLPLFFNADLYRPGERTDEPALAIDRSTPWVIAGAGSLVLALAVFGPGVGEFPQPHPLGRIFGASNASSMRLVPAPAPDAPGLVMNLATRW